MPSPAAGGWCCAVVAAPRSRLAAPGCDPTGGYRLDFPAAAAVLSGDGDTNTDADPGLPCPRENATPATFAFPPRGPRNGETNNSTRP